MTCPLCNDTGYKDHASMLCLDPCGHGEGVDQIAGKLTKAQREALIKAEPDGTLGRYFSRFISIPAGRGLVKAGLGTAVWSGVMLSRLGEQVRAYLKETEND